MDQARQGELLVRIDERLANVQELLARHIADDEAKHTDFESRIRWNERFRNWLMGALALGGGSWSALEWWK